MSTELLLSLGREALVLMVAITNFFNRLNTTFRVLAGTSWD